MLANALVEGSQQSCGTVDDTVQDVKVVLSVNRLLLININYQSNII